MERIADIKTYKKLSEDEKERHEELRDIFGQDLIGRYKNGIEAVYQRLKKQAFDDLLPYDKEFYQKASDTLSLEQQEISKKLTERAINIFMRQFMMMLTCEGRNNPLGQEHGMEYELSMKIKEYIEDEKDPDIYGKTIDSLTISQNGKRFFPEYWSRWTHIYKDY